MNESEREALLDGRIQRRLSTDRAYRHAESAEDQSEREAEIEREEDAKLPPPKGYAASSAFLEWGRS